MFPYEQIKQDRDRSWSLKLLSALSTTTDDDERDEIAEALSSLDDPRTHEPLTAILENRSLSEELRTAASDALNYCEPGDTEMIRRAWWHSGDPILMRHAIRRADRTERDLLELVAGDPEHPFYIDGIRQIECEFSEVRFQQFKINALSHSDEDVREAAARALLWDEPIAAMEPLIYVATNDTDDIADEAMHALAYLCSKRVLLWLEEMTLSSSGPRQELYRHYLDAMIEDFQSHRGYFRELVSRRLFDEWLQPVLHLLPEVPEPQVDSSSKSPRRFQEQSAKEVLTVSEVIERFGNPDGCWEQLESDFRNQEWYHFDARDRQRLLAFFLSSPDHTVRWMCAMPLEKWGEADALMGLLDDPVRWVRKSAADSLEAMPRDKRIARKMWEMLTSGNVGGWHAREILDTYVKHAPRKSVHDTLVDLALNDDREEVCMAAVCNLSARGARKHIEALAPLFYREPKVTWCLQDAMLNAHDRLGIKLPIVQHLRNVDNMFLQYSLCDAIGSGC